MTSLKNLIRAAVSDPAVTAIVAETELEPLLGRTEPICPPTYSRPSGDKSKDPYFALSPEAFVPEEHASGWHLDTKMGEKNTPITAPRVEVDSIGSQATRAEEALWASRKRLNLALPGIVVTAPSSTVVEEQVKKIKPENSVGADVLAAAIRQTFADLQPTSTWQFAHRQADAWVRYAANPDGSQVWSGGAVKDLVTRASAENAELLYQNFPNACIFGFWLSSGVAQRHRLPRAYSSEISGFDALEIKSAATKLDPMGGAPNSLTMSLTASGVALGGKNKPSDLGFGQVPTSPATRAFQCDKILQQSSLSLPVLRSLRFSADACGEKNVAASTVLTLLAIAGRTLSSEDGFLRSGCSLIPRAERWGIRRRLADPANPIENFDVPDIEQISTALHEAIDDAEALGLKFAAPIELSMSKVQAELIATRVSTELSKSASEVAEG